MAQLQRCFNFEAWDGWDFTVPRLMLLERSHSLKFEPREAAYGQCGIDQSHVSCVAKELQAAPLRGSNHMVARPAPRMNFAFISDTIPRLPPECGKDENDPRVD